MAKNIPKLSKKMRAFAEAWIGEANGNATKAAELAGYDATTRKTLAVIGYENLRKPNIKKYIQFRLKEESVTKEEIIKSLTDIMRGSVADFMTDEGNFDVRKIKKSNRSQIISKLTFNINKDGDIVPKIELQSSLRAADLLARIFDLYGGDNLPEQPVELEKDLEMLLNKAYSEKPKQLPGDVDGELIEDD